MKKTLLAVVFGLIISLLASCSSTRTAEVTETTTTRPATNSSGEVSTVKTTKTVDTDDLDTCSGVLSCTVGFVGDVIAFPFRLVAGVVEAIF